VIDAVGFQARNREHPDQERPNQVIADAARLVNPTGAIGVAGVYPDKDLHPRPGATAREDLVAPWGTLFGKGVAVRFGRTHDRRYTRLLRDLVVSGRARPGIIVTHHGSLDDAPELYQRFDRREDGVIKAVLHP
jgi:glutathione-independent formaldehyde dehydrogenase